MVVFWPVDSQGGGFEADSNLEKYRNEREKTNSQPLVLR
jgi:hypothetical protein